MNNTNNVYNYNFCPETESERLCLEVRCSTKDQAIRAQDLAKQIITRCPDVVAPGIQSNSKTSKYRITVVGPEDSLKEFLKVFRFALKIETPPPYLLQSKKVQETLEYLIDRGPKVFLLFVGGFLDECRTLLPKIIKEHEVGSITDDQVKRLLWSINEAVSRAPSWVKANALIVPLQDLLRRTELEKKLNKEHPSDKQWGLSSYAEIDVINNRSSTSGEYVRGGDKAQLSIRDFSLLPSGPSSLQKFLENAGEKKDPIDWVAATLFSQIPRNIIEAPVDGLTAALYTAFPNGVYKDDDVLPRLTIFKGADNNSLQVQMRSKLFWYFQKREERKGIPPFLALEYNYNFTVHILENGKIRVTDLQKQNLFSFPGTEDAKVRKSCQWAIDTVAKCCLLESMGAPQTQRLE